MREFSTSAPDARAVLEDNLGLLLSRRAAHRWVLGLPTQDGGGHVIYPYFFAPSRDRLPDLEEVTGLSPEALAAKIQPAGHEVEVRAPITGRDEWLVLVTDAERYSPKLLDKREREFDTLLTRVGGTYDGNEIADGQQQDIGHPPGDCPIALGFCCCGHADACDKPNRTGVQRLALSWRAS